MNSHIIESANLYLKTRPEGKIIFPSQIYEEKYIGPLNGYYVPETNIFNVIPTDTLHINNGKCSLLGFILPLNPLRYIEEKTPEKDPLSIIKEKMGLSNEHKKTLTIQPSKPIPFDGDGIAINNDISLSIKEKFIPELIRLLKYESFLIDSIQEWVEYIFKSREEDLLLGYWEDNRIYFHHIKWHFINKYINPTPLIQETYSLKLDVFSRNTGILESDIMLTKGAVFIGCGSVGSLFALELARAGVGRFMLIDSDILGYHNICRHQCGIFDVGRYKTDAVKDRILQINPYAEVVTYNMRIQEVPLDDLMKFCDVNTIVIGGADNREGDLYANNIAQHVGMPFMSIGCWERAFAGEIFYCLPTGMPTYKDFMEVTGHMSARVTQNRRFYTTEAELEKVSFEPGISVDINFVTTIAVKLAIDLLNRDNENYTQRLLPHLTQYTLVCNTNNTKVGGEMAEIFSYPLQITTSIIVPYSNKEE